MNRKTNSRIMLDSLKQFPGELPSVDVECRDFLIEELLADPNDERQWTRFLMNERALLDRVRKLDLLDMRFKIARHFVPAKSADVIEVEVRSKDSNEKRAAFSAMSGRGMTSSRMFLAWSQLERSEKLLEKAREIVELGLKVGAPASPGRLSLQMELDRIKDEQQALQAQAPPVSAAPAIEDVGTVKKARSSLPPRRRLLGSIGGPARIKAGEQKQIVEEDLVVVEEAPQIASVAASSSSSSGSTIMRPSQPPPPPSPAAATDSDDGSSRPNNRRVKFASPTPAPMGPRVSAPRPGSMSPAVIPGAARSGTSSRASLGVEASPKRSGESSFSQTPMHHQSRAEKWNAATTAANGATTAVSEKKHVEETDVDDSPSRVLFESAIKPRQSVDEHPPAAAVAVVATVPSIFSDHGAPVVVPPPPRSAAAQQQQQLQLQARADEDDGFFRAGEEVTLNSRKLRILSVMGKGGYSRVYRVLDCGSFELFALKDVNQEAEKEDKSFHNEVTILTQLAKLNRRDPAIRNRVVQLTDFHETPERSFVLLELGELDLIRLLARARRERSGLLPMMEMSEIKHYWPQMLRCVAVLHEHGFVHCDLKPGNFAMFQGRIKVIDFGIAVSVAKPEPQTRGTLNYLPPELCLSLLKRHPYEPTQPPRDIWAMGCILYELAYGRPPFFTSKGTQKERSEFLIRQIADPKHSIPLQNAESVLLLNSCVSACMSYLPSERPSAASLLAHDYF